MIIQYQFETTEDANLIIAEHKDLTLLEMQYHFNGNFLVFSTEPPKPVVIYTQVPQEEFDAMKEVVSRMPETENAILALMDISMMGGM